MPGNNLVLVDSDGLIGLANPKDPHHPKCVEIHNFMTSNSLASVTPFPIVLEASSALARDTKINRPDLAKDVLLNHALVGDKPKLDENVEKLVSLSYKKNSSRKNTPFDHYLLALAKKNHIKYIFSFDSFYKKQGLILAEELLKK